MAQRSVIVIGGGAAGLMAAITAARAGAAVTVLEHAASFGKKILSTGNGKCNLTNTEFPEHVYRGTDPSFAWAALEQFDQLQTVNFFLKLGIYTKNKNGYLYPRSEQAASVLDVLLMEARHLKIKLKTNEQVQQLIPMEGCWHVKTASWQYEGDAVIVATGSKASNIAGADDSGYRLIEKLGHSIISVYPALVPLVCEGVDFSKWAGVRVEGKIALYIDDVKQQEEQGELQLTSYGISGIPVFQLSRFAVRALEEGKSCRLLVDFLPEFSKEQTEAFLQMRKTACTYKTDRELLVGLFPDKLIPILCKGHLIQNIKQLSLKVKKARSFDAAQICSGGVDVREISRETMESKRYPGLYFAGEVMDIDGACGGYNLQFAWSTGAIAGMHAAKENE